MLYNLGVKTREGGEDKAALPRLVVGQIVRGTDFFDREKLMTDLWRYLPAESVELVAPRRFGKSSVMRRLSDDPQNGCLVVYTDCQGFASEAQFFSRLFADICIASGSGRLLLIADRARTAVGGAIDKFRTLGIAGFKFDLNDSKPDSPEERMERVRAALELTRRPAVLILDEFSVMLSNFLKAGVPREQVVAFLAQLRKLRLSESCRVAMVIGGSMSLEYWLRQLNASGLMNDVRRVVLPAFDTDTATRFLSALFTSEGLSLETGAVQAVLGRLDPAVPYWLTAMVWLLEQSPGRVRAISVADVGDAYDNRLLGTEGRHYFEPFAERLRRDRPEFERPILRLLTELARSSADGGMTKPEMRELFEHELGASIGAEFDSTLADLESEFYLVVDEARTRYLFGLRVLRDWWLRWQGGDS